MEKEKEKPKILIRKCGVGFVEGQLAEIAGSRYPNQTHRVRDTGIIVDPRTILPNGEIRVRVNCDYRETTRVLVKKLIEEAHEILADYIFWDYSLVHGHYDTGSVATDETNTDWRIQTQVYLKNPSAKG